MNKDSGASHSVTFDAYPIETAPDKRELLLWCPKRGKWLVGVWDDQRYHSRPRPYWRTWGAFSVDDDRTDQPTLWASSADWHPKPSVKDAATKPVQEVEVYKR